MESLEEKLRKQQLEKNAAKQATEHTLQEQLEEQKKVQEKQKEEEIRTQIAEKTLQIESARKQIEEIKAPRASEMHGRVLEQQEKELKDIEEKLKRAEDDLKKLLFGYKDLLESAGVTSSMDLLEHELYKNTREVKKVVTYMRDRVQKALERDETKNKKMRAEEDEKQMTNKDIQIQSVEKQILDLSEQIRDLSDYLPETREKYIGAIAEQIYVHHIKEFSQGSKIDSVIQFDNIAAKKILDTEEMHRLCKTMDLEKVLNVCHAISQQISQKMKKKLPDNKAIDEWTDNLANMLMREYKKQQSDQMAAEIQEKIIQKTKDISSVGTKEKFNFFSCKSLVSILRTREALLPNLQKGLIALKTAEHQLETMGERTFRVYKEYNNVIGRDALYYSYTNEFDKKYYEHLNVLAEEKKVLYEGIENNNRTEKNMGGITRFFKGKSVMKEKEDLQRRMEDKSKEIDLANKERESYITDFSDGKKDSEKIGDVMATVVSLKIENYEDLFDRSMHEDNISVRELYKKIYDKLMYVIDEYRISPEVHALMAEFDKVDNSEYMDNTVYSVGEEKTQQMNAFINNIYNYRSQ